MKDDIWVSDCCGAKMDGETATQGHVCRKCEKECNAVVKSRRDLIINGVRRQAFKEMEEKLLSLPEYFFEIDGVGKIPQPFLKKKDVFRVRKDLEVK